MIVTFFVLLLTLVAVIGITLPIYINTNGHRDKLAEIIGDTVGGKASIEELDLSLSMGLKIVAKGLKVTDDQGKLELLSAKKIDLTIRVLPFIFRRHLSFKEITIDTPHFILNKNSDGIWKTLVNLPDKPADESEWSQIPGGNISSLGLTHNIIIKDGIVDIVAEREVDPINMQIRDINITATPQERDKPIKVEMYLKIPERNKLVDLTFNGTINLSSENFKDSSIEGTILTGRLSPRIAGAYLEKFPIYSRLNAAGIMSANLKVNLNGEYAIEGKVDHILPASEAVITRKDIFTDKTRIPLEFFYNLEGGKDFLHLNQIRLSGAHGTINISGNITNINSDNPDIYFSANTSEVDIEWLKANLYPEIFSKNLREFITTHISGGKGRLEEILFKGNWTNLKEINKEENLRLLEGKIDLEGVNIIKLGKYKDLEEINGSFAFLNGNLSYENVDLRYKGCGFYATSGSIENIVSPTIDIKISTVLGIKKGSPCQIFNINKNNVLTWLGGTILLKSDLKGNIGEKWNLLSEGELDASGASFTYGYPFRKEVGTNNIIKYKLEYADNRLNIDSASINVNSSTLSLTGGVDFSKDGGHQIQIKSNDIKTADFVTILRHIEKRGKGIVRVVGDISGKNNNIDNTKIKGDILLNKVGFKIVNSLKEVNNLNANITALDRELIFQEVTWFFDQNIVNLSGRYSWLGKKVLRFKIAARDLNIDYLLPKDKTRQKKKTKIQGTINTTKGSYKGIPFENLILGMDSNDRRFIAKPFFCNGFKGGDISGNWQVGQEGINIDIIAKDVEINDIGHKLSLDSLKEIKGKGIISVRLKGKGDNAQARKETIEGEASLILKDGVIRRLSVLSRIFSLLNLSKVMRFEAPDLQTEGMSYKQITSNFKIKGGIAETEDFLLDSDSLLMSGVGEVNLKDNSLDMIVGVQPFQLLDRVLSSIPLAGKVLTGDKEAFIIHYYSVSGPLKNTKVNGLPVETVSKLIINIIKNIITLPRDIIRDLNNKQGDHEKKKEGVTTP